MKMANLLLDASKWTDGTNTPPSQYNEETKLYEFLAGGVITLLSPASDGDFLKFTTTIAVGTFGLPLLIRVISGENETDHSYDISETDVSDDIQLSAGDMVTMTAMNGGSYYYGDVIISPIADPQPTPNAILKQLYRKYNDGSSIISDEKYRAVDGFQFVQSEPSNSWYIKHDKGSSSFSVNVFIDDELVECDIDIIDNFSVFINFSNQVSGFANLLFLIDRAKKIILPTPTPSTSISITPSPTPTPTPSPISQADYVSTVLAKSPIVYWSLTSLSDNVSGNVLTLGQNASLSSDTYGNTLFFAQAGSDSSGLGAFMATPAVFQKNYTLEAWIKPTAFNDYNTIFGDTNSSNYGFQFESVGGADGDLYLYGSNDGIDSGFPVSIGSYLHVVLTVDDNANVRFYVNGSIVNSIVNQSVDTYTYGIIGDDTYATEAFIGYIGDPAIYDYTLSADQILENYNAGLNYRYGSDTPLPSPSVTPTLSLTPTISVTPTITPTISVTPSPIPYAVSKPLARLNNNGSVDTTFAPINFAYPLFTSGVYTIVQNSDNKIYVGGYDGMVRLNQDYSIDNTFDGTAIFGSNDVQNIILTPTNIFCAGRKTTDGATSGTYVSMLNNDGSFNSTITVSSLSNAIFTMLLTNDNKIYVSGQGPVSRINSDGTVDSSYVTIAHDSSVKSLYQTADNKIYVGGIFTTMNGVSSQGIARLNADGTFDSSFSITFIGNNTSISNIIQTADGKIYLVGAFNYNNTNFGLLRLNSDGTVDTTFTPLNLTYYVLNSITQTIDDKIYVGGQITAVNGSSYNNLFRLNSDGTLDTTFANITFPQFTSCDAIYQVPDGSGILLGI